MFPFFSSKKSSPNAAAGNANTAASSRPSDGAQTQQAVPPPHFCCPITLSLMEEPVIAPDGNSYDFEALRRWAATCPHNPPTLPTTNLPFDLDKLVKNLALKDAIQHWKAANGQGSAPPAPPSSTSTTAAEGVVEAIIPPTRYFSSPNGEAFVAVPPPSGPERHLHVVVVIDVSGSMQLPAEMKDEKGEKSEVANSVLDIVKYAAKAVAHMLGPKDCFSIVTFSNTAKAHLICKPTRNDADLKVIDDSIRRINASGCTNLGDGLRCALQLVVDNFQKDPSRINAVMMLTDGQPNEGPGALNVLDSFRRSEKVVEAFGNRAETTVGEIIRKQTVVNTFAFGYSHTADGLCSGLMFDVASLGNGVYGYIPDIGFLGTQFIHCIANLRAVASIATCVMGSTKPNEVGLWTVQYGKIGLSCKNPASLDDVDFSKPVAIADSAQGAGALEGLTAEEVAAVKAALPAARAGYNVSNALLTLLRGPVKTCTYNKNGVRCDEGARSVPVGVTEEMAKVELTAAVTGAGGALSDLEGLAEDIESQVSVAFKSAYFARWGLHYLYSWLSAQQRRVCNNFKDKSLAIHKTPFVKVIHDKYDDIFNMMAPPEPTLPETEPASFSTNTYRGSVPLCGSAAPMAAAPMQQQQRQRIQTSRQINSSYNPCVHENTRIAMADGSMKPARLVRSGDLVTAGPRDCNEESMGKALRIGHIIRTQCANKTVQLVRFPSQTPDEDGLLITPWHPVLVQDTPAQLSSSSYAKGTLEWMMPLNTGYPLEEYPCSHVYSFTVEEATGPNALDTDEMRMTPVLVAEGVAMVYLGHNYKAPSEGAYNNDKILSHQFFGTSMVLEQLAEHHPNHKHHEFAHAPVLKADVGDGSGCVAVGWDMSKYIGTW